MDGWRRKFSIDDFMRRCGAWLPLLSLAAAGAGLVYALARFCFEIRAVSGVYYDAATVALGDAARLCIMLGGAVAAVFCTLPWRKGWRSRLNEGEKILRPALLLWLIPCTCFPGVLLAILVFAGITACSILLSLAFGQPLSQFSFTEDFSFTGVGIGSALLTILVASIIEEVGWKGYCEDSIGNYMNWFWESMIFGALWSFWHFPLIFIQGTYQAGLMVNPLYVINFFVSGIPLGFIITWVYLASDRSILACMVFHLFVNFMQEKIAMTPETKCVQTIVVIAATVIIVAAKRDMFFETRHVGRLLDSVSGK